MFLNLYHEPHPEKIIDTLHPFTITFNGSIGGAIDKQIYLRNSSLEHFYTDISIEAVDTSHTLDRTARNPAGYYWKLSSKTTPVSLEEWEEIPAGNTLSLSDNLGSSSKADIFTYLSIWVRISIPPGQRIQTIKNIVFRITATEGLI